MHDVLQNSYRRQLLLGGVAAASLGAAPSLVAVPPPSRHKILEALAAEEQPGMAAAVLQRGILLGCGATGVRNDSTHARVTETTVFEIGSITKVFTALLVHQAHERKRLDVGAPVGRYVPSLPAAWQSVKLQQLLSHTSGVPNYLSEDNFLNLMPTSPTPEALIAMAAERPVESAPGTRFAYSNTNYILRGLALEHACGQRYWDLLAKEILVPVGMTCAGPRLPFDTRPIAQGHLFRDGRWIAPVITAPGAAWAAGGLLASLEDVTKFLIALDRDEILPRRSLQKMWLDTTLADGSGAGWGAGWELANGGAVVGHGGGTAGFTAYLRHVPSLRRSTIVLINRAGDINPQAIAERIDKAAGG